MSSEIFFYVDPSVRACENDAVTLITKLVDYVDYTSILMSIQVEMSFYSFGSRQKIHTNCKKKNSNLVPLKHPKKPYRKIRMES